jgi:hypothetical protein
MTVGIELGPEGHAIGRDPRKMAPDDLRALGHAPMSPTAAIRAHCLDCCGGSDEVRKCAATRCPSWPFRTGVNPWRAPLSDAEKARRRNLLARAGKIAENSSKPEKSRQPNAGLPPAAISAPGDEATAPRS